MFRHFGRGIVSYVITSRIVCGEVNGFCTKLTTKARLGQVPVPYVCIYRVRSWSSLHRQAHRHAQSTTNQSMSIFEFSLAINDLDKFLSISQYNPKGHRDVAKSRDTPSVAQGWWWLLHGRSRATGQGWMGALQRVPKCVVLLTTFVRLNSLDYREC